MKGNLQSAGWYEKMRTELAGNEKQEGQREREKLRVRGVYSAAKPDLFSERFAMILGALAMRPAELSRKTGISKTSLSRYLSGEYLPNRQKITLLARALHVTEDYLLCHVDDPNETFWKSDVTDEQSDGRNETQASFPAERLDDPSSGKMLKAITDMYKKVDRETRVKMYTAVCHIYVGLSDVENNLS